VGQVIVNLAVNARDAMAHGGTLTLSTAGEILADGMPGFHLRPAPGAYARLTVSDTGTGMPAEVLERLFEPFYTTKRSQGEHGAAGGTGGARGTGLGLSTVYGILERNGGGIRVETEAGAGSSFHVYLPAAPPEREGGQGGLGRASIPEPEAALAFAGRGET
jgi:signal transduction histidine kinase